MTPDEILRKHLLQLLGGGNAHMNFKSATLNFPLEHINANPPNTPYTPWHLLEHLRIVQWDILEFTINPDHISPEFPKGLWPALDATADEKTWKETIFLFEADLKMMEGLVEDPKTNLTTEIPHAPGYTILREVLLVADHNAYHIGEFAILRQIMGTWR